jgi:hypothetical protein
VSACRLGVLAFGDSITNGGGELQWGVALQSWALWVARGLALPYSGYAGDGARVADVLAEQLPAVPDSARYDLGCLYVGVNDVRALDWDRARFEAGHRAALAFLAERCDGVLPDRDRRAGARRPRRRRHGRAPTALDADPLRDHAHRPATRRPHVRVSASEGVGAGGLGSTPSRLNRYGT